MARKKLPLLVLAALMGLSAAYFILWVEPRRDDLVELDFRRLAAMAERIDMQLATYRQVVANATRQPGPLPPPLELRSSGPAARNASADPAVSIREERGGQRFLLTAANLQAGLRIEDVVRRAHEPNTFDKLILATSDGSILYQEGRKDIQLVTLAGLDIGGKDVPQMSRSTGLYEAELSGRRYKVFVQPCSSLRAPARPGQEPAGGWVLFALMSAPHFHVRSLEVSANWIILILGIALLALLALPFLKLLTIGKGARLRAIDGLLAGLCALIGLSVLTVLLLDGFVYRNLEEKEKKQVEDLAGDIRDAIREDVKGALLSFDALRKDALLASRDPGKGTKVSESLKSHATFFWADASGEQIFKWRQNGVTQLISVADRSYFHQAMEGQGSLCPKEAGSAGCYALESIRSWITGEDEVAIATPEPRGVVRLQGSERRSAVAVLTTRMSSVHGAVLPPGFGFAVIDANGKVLFHSERRRMLQENFLEEAGSETLEALAAAPRAGAVEAFYKGRKNRMFLEPISEHEWSVVAFREMTLLRATNVQIVTVALVCLIFYAALFLALFSAVYVASSTRARWLWPAGARQGAYLQLAVFYAGCLLVYLFLLSDGAPAFLLTNGMLIPLLVLFVSYIKVRADEKLLDKKQMGALSGALALLAVSGMVGLPGIDPATRLWTLASLAVGGLFLFLPIVTRLFGRWRPASFRTTYLCAATLLLMVLTILPAASFFKLACDVPLENMLKLGQLHLMRQLAPEKDPKSYADVFFNTKELPSPPECKASGEGQPSEGQRPQGPHGATLLKFLERIFPVYSPHSQVLAQLSPDSAEGWSWHWDHQKGLLLFHRDASPGQKVRHLSSNFHSVKPKGLAWLGLGAGVLALGLISLGLVWLMANNLMLLHTGAPMWLDRRKLSLGTSVTHLVYVSSRPERLRVPARSYIGSIDLAAPEDEIESGRLLERLAPAARKLIVVRGFEHRLDDRGFNWTKLVLLETFVSHGGRRVILLSDQDPYLCLAAGLLTGGGDEPARDQEEKERWRRLLSRFAVVDLDGRAKDAKKLSEKLQRTRKRLLADAGRFRRIPWSLHVDGCLHVVREECSPTSPLQEIGIELLPDLHFGESSRGEILQEILARAEGYYTDLWSSLPEDEKLVLLQLAEEGLTNPRNLRPLQRLIARGLVRRDPAPRLMNETFRLFVFAAAAQEGVHRIEMRHEQESAWGQLKVPLTATLLGGLFFFGITQQEMFKTTLSGMAVVAGTLPHLLQLVGYLGATKAPLPPIR